LSGVVVLGLLGPGRLSLQKGQKTTLMRLVAWRTATALRVTDLGRYPDVPGGV